MRTIVIGIAAAVLSLWCGPVAAQKKVEEEAKLQFEIGLELYEKGQYDKAALAFARAYELRPSYKILFNIGQAESELGHATAALEAFTRYLAEGGDQIDAERRAAVKKETTRLSALVGSVVIETDAEGATVFIDERRVGDLPLPSSVFVDSGEHTIVIKRGAVELHREVVTVAGGQSVAVKAALGEDGAGTDDGTDQGTAAEDDGAKPKRVWTWVAIGVGGAAAVGAAVTGAMSLSETNAIKDDCDGNACPASLEDKGDKARTLALTADALIAVAAVGVAAGVVLFFVEPKLKERKDTVEVAPVVAPTADGGVLALVGRF